MFQIGLIVESGIQSTGIFQWFSHEMHHACGPLRIWRKTRIFKISRPPFALREPGVAVGSLSRRPRGDPGDFGCPRRRRAPARQKEWQLALHPQTGLTTSRHPADNLPPFGRLLSGLRPTASRPSAAGTWQSPHSPCYTT